MNSTAHELRTIDAAALKRAARSLGFDLCGIAAADKYPELAYLREWLDRGYAGEMHYLHRTADRRMDVTSVMPSAKTVVALGTIYNVDRPYSTECADPSRAGIARYAWGDDYHVVIQQRMDALVRWMHEQAGAGLEARAYVDTGPVQERVFAQYAGLGWIGKNTCVINAELGSWIFLSEILCNLPLVPDSPALDRCGTCTLCLEACPTGALVDAHVLDSRKCISYLTIELKDTLPEEYRESIGRHAYGCDICQDVCPWNQQPGTAASTDSAWIPRPGLDGQTLLHLWERTDDELRALLKGSAMKRAGVRRLRRNLAVAIGNSRDPAAIAALEHHDEDPLIAEHVAWARRRNDS